MLFRCTQILFFVFFLVVSGGCSGLGGSLSITRIPTSADPELAVQGDSASLVKVQVRDFQDVRTAPFIGKYEGRELNAEGDVPVTVRHAVEEEFRRRGADVHSIDGFSVQGKVRKWHVQVESGFPTNRAEAFASLEMSILNSYQEVVYRGLYSGDTIGTHPFMSKASVEEILGEAMYYAILEAFKDESFMQALNQLPVARSNTNIPQQALR